MTASKISGPHTSREEKDVGRILTAIPSGGGKFAAVVSSNLPGGGGKTETNFFEGAEPNRMRLPSQFQ